MHWGRRSLRFVAIALGAALGVSGCHGGARTGAQLTPPLVSPSHVEPSHARLKEYLYATTLDWNAGNGTVYYYDAYGKNTSALGSLTISSGFPDGVWTDRKGNVYVAVVNSVSNGRGYINVYTPAFGKLLRSYTAGLDGPSGGTFDAAGDMYVANLCGMAPSIQCFVFASPKDREFRRHVRLGGSTSGYVAIYPAGKMYPSSYLQSPINIAVGVGIDASNNVFVVNNTGGIAWNVIKFRAGQTQGKVVTFRDLPRQRWVGADTFDPQNALVVSVNTAVDFFAREHGKPSRTLTDGIVAADGLAYGLDGTLFAGNYEFESNEGNIVAFPRDADKPARTYAVPYGNG
ncbi:MAG: hypothetical protein JO113_06890, partial [Candidatus Eremiobacteraeota bacterium]|nr:hypothetical protein [Candidatus Eremiobacteraeota bacterium]